MIVYQQQRRNGIHLGEMRVVMKEGSRSLSLKSVAAVSAITVTTMLPATAPVLWDAVQMDNHSIVAPYRTTREALGAIDVEPGVDFTQCEEYLTNNYLSINKALQDIQDDDSIDSDIKQNCLALTGYFEKNQIPSPDSLDIVQRVYDYTMQNFHFVPLQTILFLLLSSSVFRLGRTSQEIRNSLRDVKSPSINRRGALQKTGMALGCVIAAGAAGYGLRSFVFNGDKVTDHVVDHDEDSGEVHEVGANIQDIVSKEIHGRSPSSWNTGTMFALGGTFVVDVSRALGLKKQIPLSKGVSDFLDVTPTAGVAMFAAELARIAALSSSDNAMDREYAHHEWAEMKGSAWMIPFFTFLSHFAEQGISVSPDADRKIRQIYASFNGISGGYSLCPGQRRECENQADWLGHHKKAKQDVLKASGDLLVFSTAPSALIIPTVYASSELAEGSMDKLQISLYEYYFSEKKALGVDDDESQAYAIKNTNIAMKSALKFKMAFVDNVVAGLGTDGPVIPTLIKLIEHDGVKGVLNYYAVMIPNIMKYAYVGYNTFLSDIFGGGDTLQSQMDVFLIGVGEVLWNGARVNLVLLEEAWRQTWESFGEEGGDNTRHATFIENILNSSDAPGDVVKKVSGYLGDSTRGTPFGFNMVGAGIDLFSVQIPKWIEEARENIVSSGETKKESPKNLQYRQLVDTLQTLLVERFGVLETWNSSDVVAKKDILDQLIRDDQYLQKWMEDRHNCEDEMSESELHNALVDMLKQSVNPKSLVVRNGVLHDSKDDKKYPALADDDIAIASATAFRMFVRSHRLSEKTANIPHAEAAKEVFAALSVQITGAIIGVSTMRYITSKNIFIPEGETAENLAKPVEDFVDNLGNGTNTLGVFLTQRFQERQGQEGDLSAYAIGQINMSIQNVENIVRALKNTPNNHEIVAKLCIAYVDALEAIDTTMSMDDALANLNKVSTFGAIGTPVADNIAAVIFMIQASFDTVRKSFGEEALRATVDLSQVPFLADTPGLGGFFKTPMSTGSALDIVAALLGINLGSGTPFGNGVQLGELLRIIEKVNSNHIGDFSTKKESVTRNMSEYIPHKNKYAALEISWTILDVQKMLSEILDTLRRFGSCEDTGLCNEQAA